MHQNQRFSAKFAIVFALTIFVGAANAPAQDNTPEAVMVAHFIAVGQADSTLLQFPDGAILIDAGCDDEHRETLTGYLQEFFRAHPDLNNTLDSIFITHPHIDHTACLPDVVLHSGIKVKRYIDNGRLSDRGDNHPSGVQQIYQVLAEANRFDTYFSIIDTSGQWSESDESNENIDPIDSARIRVLKGGFNSTSANDNSLVIRVDFGEASFLFTGDLEEDGIDSLIKRYAGTDLLDVDVYQVGHHGSANGTTQELAEAMSPEIAVFSMGRWDYGIDRQYEEDRFNTWWYGHPRKIIVDMLSKAVTGNRLEPRKAMVFKARTEPVQQTIGKQLYGTGWDGTIRILATKAGEFTIATDR